MEYKLNINNRAFNAIKNKTKKVEIRVTKDDLNYNDVKKKDIINFTSVDGDTMSCIVTENNHYNTIEELLTMEGTKYTLSSTDDFNEGVKSINSLDGYKENIAIHGVHAIHIEPCEDKYIIITTLCDKKEIMNEIVKTLLDKKLVVGSQVYECFSKYYWEGKIEESKEYKIEFRTRMSRYNEVEKIIQEIHDYDLCEISYQEISGEKGFLNWIDEEIKGQ